MHITETQRGSLATLSPLDGTTPPTVVVSSALCAGPATNICVTTGRSRLFSTSPTVATSRAHFAGQAKTTCVPAQFGRAVNTAPVLATRQLTCLAGRAGLACPPAEFRAVTCSLYFQLRKPDVVAPLFFLARLRRKNIGG